MSKINSSYPLWNYDYCNPFNHSKDLFFSYSQAQINTICQQIKLQAKLTFPIITNKISTITEQYLTKTLEQCQVLLGVYNQSQEWAFYSIVKVEGRVELNYKNPRGKKIAALQNIVIGDIDIHSIMIEEGVVSQITQNDGFLYPLKILNDHSQGRDVYWSPKTYGDIVAVREELGQIYLSACLRKWPAVQWKKQSYSEKKQLLQELKPQLPEQFAKLFKIPNNFLNFEINNLLKEAMSLIDSQMILRILQSGFRIRFLKNEHGQSIDLHAFLKHQTEKNPNKKQESVKIEGYFRKFGIYAGLQVDINKLCIKNNEHTKILAKMSSLRKKPVELFASFHELLQKTLHGLFVTLQIIASGRFAVRENNKNKSLIDTVVNAVFSKVPYVGSTFVGMHNGFRQGQRIDHAKRLMRKLPIDNKEIIADYSIRVVQQYSEQIATPTQQSYFQELKNYFQKQFNEFLNINEKEFSFDGSNYTMAWTLLCFQYSTRFMDFMDTAKANTNPNILGIRAAYESFQFHNLTPGELQRFTQETHYDKKKARILSKMISFSSQIQKYPSSLNDFGKIFWCNTSLQKQKLKIKINAFVLVKGSIIFIIVNSQDKVKLYQKITKQFASLIIGEQLLAYFQQLLDLASFVQPQKQKNHSLVKILDNLTNEMQEPLFVMGGFETGSVYCALLHMLLKKSYSVSEKRIITYGFSSPKWCHINNISNAFDVLKYYYLVYFVQQKISGEENYAELGKRFYLKGGELKKDSPILKDYIEYLSDKPQKEVDASSQEPKQGKAQQELQYPSYDATVYENKEYDERDLFKAVKEHNLPLLKYLITLQRVDVNQVFDVNNQSLFYCAISQVPNKNCGDQSQQFINRYKKSFEIVRYLLEGAKVDINKKNRVENGIKRVLYHGDQLPIHCALGTGDVELVKYLISKGADSTSQFRLGVSFQNGLSLAIQSQNLQLVKFLIEQKKVQIKNVFFQSAKPQILQYLLSKGLNPNNVTTLMGINVGSLLSNAVSQGNYELSKSLLQKGANPNFLINFQGYGSCVHMAAHAKNIRILSLLLEYGGKLQQKLTHLWVKYVYKQSYKKTALFYLQQQEDEIQVYKYLKILKLQGYIPNQFYNFQDFMEDWRKQFENRNHNYYFISTYFTSQIIRTQDYFNKQAVVKKKKNADLTAFQRNFEEFKKQFFEGPSWIQKFNKAIKYLYSFYDSQRHEKALKICDQFPTYQIFIFLRAVILLQFLQANSQSSRNQYLCEQVSKQAQKITVPILQNYIIGELLALSDLQEAFEYYKLCYEQDDRFYHPKIKMLKIAFDAERIGVKIDFPIQTSGTKLYQECQKLLLPIDLAAVFQEIQESNVTNNFIQSYTEQVQNIEKRTFSQALSVIFSIDPIFIKQRLEQLIPQKVYKFDLCYEHKGKKQSTTCKSILKSINYAFSIMKKGNLNPLERLFKDQELPRDKYSPFFYTISRLIEKIQALHEAIAHKCSSKRDFNSPRQYEMCLNYIQDLICYYQDYIERVVSNFLQDSDQLYRKKFYEALGQQLDVKKDISVYCQTTFLKNSANKDSQLPYCLKFSEATELTIDPPSNDQMYGTHKVVVLPLKQKNQIYFKYEPYAPGIEFAVSSLYKLILPNSTPQTLIVKLEAQNKSALYLASKAVTGRNFAEVINQQDLIRALDMKNFSSLFISSFIVCTGDSKPDNFVMHFNYDTRGLVSTELVSIDNDIAFYKRGLKVNSSQKKLYSDMLNILYLMPQMKEPVSPYLKNYLTQKEHQPQIIMAEWLGSLYLKNKSYQKMEGFNKEDLKKLKLPIKLPKGTACKVYSIMKKLCNFMKEQNITHSQIFERLSPSLAYFYEKYRDTTSVINSLKNLYIAAGADPKILNSLYSLDKIISSKAWNTMSSSKRRDQTSFQKLFSSSISYEAEMFIKSIDFKDKDLAVCRAIRENLYFVDNILLKNARTQQLFEIIDSPKMQALSVKIADNYQIQQSKKKSEKQQAMVEKIGSVFDILDRKILLKRGHILHLIRNENLNINEVNQNLETVLFEIVKRLQSKQISYDLSQKLIKLFLDCGINTKLKNKQGFTIMNFPLTQSRHPEIIIQILEHKPSYFYQLIRDRRFSDAQAILKSTNSPIFTSKIYNDEQLQQDIDQMQSLKQIFSDKNCKMLAFLILNKKTYETSIFAYDILHLFIQAYPDDDTDILKLILKEDKENLTVSIHRKVNGDYAADIALRMKKFKFLMVLLNENALIAEDLLDLNLKLAYKACKHSIILDINDITKQYDHRKLDSQGKNIFEIMTQKRDKDILSYINLLQDYKQALRQLAKQYNFFQLLEILFSGEELQDYSQGKEGNILAADENIKKLSAILKKYGFSITIYEARMGIDLFTKFDTRGNTVLAMIVKKYLQIDRQMEREELLKEIKFIFSVSSKSYGNFTLRSDANTALHLAVRGGSSTLVMELLNYIEVNPPSFNSQGQSPQMMTDNVDVRALVRSQDLQSYEKLKKREICVSKVGLYSRCLNQETCFYI